MYNCFNEHPDYQPSEDFLNDNFEADEAGENIRQDFISRINSQITSISEKKMDFFLASTKEK